jgi:arylsulfatase A-like enzyme
VVDDTIKWLETRPAEKPFFLYVHTIDPHVPYIPPRKYWMLYDKGPYTGPVQAAQTASLLENVKSGKQTLSDRDKFRLEALYDGEITYHDDQIIRLHDALKRMGLLEDTLIVITSDHGEEFFEHGKVGHGHSLYEELVHVPLLVRLPGATAGPGIHSSAEISLVDILPTACETLGVECPEGVEGESLLPLLKGREHDRYPSVSFSNFLGVQRAVRMGPFKAIYKAHIPFVYDLSTDSQETHNISREQPVVLSGLRDAFGKQMGRFIDSEANTVKKRTVRHKKEDVNIDPETRRQLRALGYLGED